MNQNVSDQDWLPMTEVAELLQISYYKLQRLVDRGTIQSQHDDLDRRKRLVKVADVKRVFRIK